MFYSMNKTIVNYFAKGTLQIIIPQINRNLSKYETAIQHQVISNSF